MARQMKDSGVEWMGEIPETWDILPAKRMFCNSGETKKADDVQLTASQQYGIISQSDYMALTGSRVVLATQDLEKWKHVEPQDFIISLRSFQGGLEMSKVSGCITWHYVVLRSCHKGINARFYKWLFKSSEYITALQRTCNYIRDGQDLRYSNFEQVPLFLPKEEEQEIIANILDTKCAEIDKVVEQTRATIEEYKKLKQAIITEAVTKGVRGPRPLKPSGVEWIGDIPEEWECRKLKTLVLEPDSVFIDGDWIESKDISSSGIRYFTTGNVGDGVFKHQGTGYVSEKTFQLLNCTEARGGDLVFSRLNLPVGRACILPPIDKCVVAVDVVIARLDSICYNKYIMYTTMCDRYQSLTAILARGTTMQRISRTQLGNISFPFPYYNEQQEIATYLDTKCAEIDLIIEKKEQLIEELGSYKKSLIYEYVTGKKEVTA